MDQTQYFKKGRSRLCTCKRYEIWRNELKVLVKHVLVTAFSITACMGTNGVKGKKNQIFTMLYIVGTNNIFT